MANTHSTLTSLFTDIADAIREKTGEEGTIKADDFPDAITGISSGVELNFEIVGGTTQPTNPKENTIWVNTNIEISSWEFSTKKPLNPIAGMIWFSTNNRFSMQNFNALKENNITIYLTGCQQYVDNTWTNCDAKIYNGTSWVSLWNGELYYLGNEFENITGGWEVVGLAYKYGASASEGTRAGVPTIVKNANSLTVTQPGSSSGVIKIINDIDLTNYNTVIFEMEGEIISYAMGSIVVYKSDIENFEYTSGVTTYNNVDAFRSFSNGSNKVVLPRAYYSLSVADLQGNYTIGFHLKNGNSPNMSVTIHSVILKQQNPTTGWDGTLFANGNQYVDITGGWIDRTSVVHDASWYSNGTVTKATNCISLQYRDKQIAAVGTNNAIDCTKYTSLKINIIKNTSTHSRMVVKSSAIPTQSTFDAKVEIDNKTGVQTIDITGFSNLYICAMIWNDSGTGELQFDRVWLE